MNKQRITAIYLLGLTALLPLKFGSLVGLPEAQSFFPEDAFSYLIVLWPPSSLGLFGALGLLFALWSFGAEPLTRCDRSGLCALALWMGLPLVGLSGFIHASSVETAVLETGHLLGAACYIGGIALYVAKAGETAFRKLLYALGIGTLLTAALAIDQYFSGFAETREFMRKQAEAYQHGGDGGDIGALLADQRVFATFSSCNALAGFLAGALPVVVYVLYRWGGRVEPVKLSRGLFIVLGTMICLTALALTRSRAAVAALAAGLVVYSLVRPMAGKYKIAVLGVIFLGVIGGGVYAHFSDRGMQSMGARVTYLRSAAIMLYNQPLAGSGWGDFFHDHMKLKELQTKEAAHTPHNFVAAFASQCGFFGLLWSLALLLFPLWALWRRWRSSNDAMMLAAALGLTFFTVHTLMDIDMQIPACLALAGLCSAGLLYSPGVRNPEWIRKVFKVAAVLFAVASLGVNGHLLYSEYRIGTFSDMVSLRNKTPEDAAALSPEAVWRQLLEVARTRPYGIAPWMNAGDFFLWRNDLDRAEMCFREAVMRTPERPSNYHRLGVIELRRNQPAKAAEHFRKMQSLFPNNPQYRDLPVGNAP